MAKIETVLCPIDFSPVSDKELNLAVHICERFGARMILHHNIDNVPPVYMANAWMYSEAHMYPEEEKEVEASRLLEAIFAKLPKTIQFEGRVTFGRLDECILHLARELPADLIVMGTHDPRRAEHVSFTDRILAQSPCPILTTREASPVAKVFPNLRDACPLQTVVLPMDFSTHSLHALEYALSLMEVLPLTLHLLHVEATVDLDDLLTLAHPPHFREQKQQRIHASLERLRGLVPTEYLSRTKFEVRMGSVIGEIITYAQEVRATLIFMGAHPKNVFDRLIFGANSQGVLHQSPCPVWLVPQKQSSSTHWVTAAAAQAGQSKGTP